MEITKTQSTRGQYEVYIDDAFVLEILNMSGSWRAFFVMDGDEQPVTSSELRQIADKLDELNNTTN